MQNAAKNSKPVLIHQTLEDYTLRYAPHTFRRWSPLVVAVTALGGIAYLADFSIGASIGLLYGSLNALVAIALAALIIFITGFPLAFYAAKYNIDLDLITRGAGFGYYGSVLTSLIFASFTFIFFALEGSIMAQGLALGLGIPLWLGYLISTLMVIPLVLYGMKALSRMQVWTTPLWLFLMFGPVIYLIIHDPQLFSRWMAYSGSEHNQHLNFAAIVLGAGVTLSLMGQIGEQIDYLRFMPAPTAANRKTWWLALIAAGPGWVILGAIKQAIGAFLAVYILAASNNTLATEPVQQFIGAFILLVPKPIALILAVILVVISQIKINVTNAYSGSLAWTNAFTRVTRYYPGRLVFVLLNLLFALILMEANMFAFLTTILGFYSNCAIAWVVVVATDIVINKYMLGLSPKYPEYRKNMLYPLNPVGLTAFICATGLSILAYFGGLGVELKAYSPLLAIGLAFLITPLMAILTRGKYYLRKTHDGITEPRFDASGIPCAEQYSCDYCLQGFERPDVSMLDAKVICSLCEATRRYTL